MIGSAHKLLVSLALLSSASLSSCDNFNGSLVAMTITWPYYPPACGMTNPPGCQPVPQPALLPASNQRIEMWGKFSTGEIRRLAADVGPNGDNSFTGFSIVPALDPNDPCLIRGLDRDDQDCQNGKLDAGICGAPMFSKKAYATPGVSDNEAVLLQQQLVLQGRKITSVTTPFSAVDMVTTGSALGPLLTLVQWDPDSVNAPRTRMTTAAVSPTSAVNPALCRSYRDGDGVSDSTKHSYFYVGNPRQITKPLSGVQFGFLAYATGPGSTTPNLPSQNFNGISFSLTDAVDDIQQIIITLEGRGFSSTFDPTAVQLFLANRLPESASGRGAIRMVILANSTPPLAPGPIPAPTFLPTSAVGTLSILSGIDSVSN